MLVYVDDAATRDNIEVTYHGNISACSKTRVEHNPHFTTLPSAPGHARAAGQEPLVPCGAERGGGGEPGEVLIGISGS